MKIRAKLLILLLIIAVTPLLFTTIYGFVTVRNMGDSLADQVGEALQDRLKHQLQLMVRYNAKMLQQKQALVEAWLKLLADAAQQALSAGNPASEPAYLAADFDAGRVPAKQIHPSGRHFELEGDGGVRPIPVSTEAQVLNIAPGVDPDAVADSIPRLSSLTHIYKSGYDRQPNLFYWIYTSLENGLHSSFPGHGGYPEDYDGRKRPWYVNAVSAG